ncbi:MAG: T9SS type A sorting domain-containing protein [Lewinellaceae bacterium]|nr:T9SS type A sorting domain-containing protein [Lewinellaceae bacterium]
MNKLKLFFGLLSCLLISSSLSAQFTTYFAQASGAQYLLFEAESPTASYASGDGSANWNTIDDGGVMAIQASASAGGSQANNEDAARQVFRFLPSATSLTIYLRVRVTNGNNNSVIIPSINEFTGDSWGFSVDDSQAPTYTWIKGDPIPVSNTASQTLSLIPKDPELIIDKILLHESNTLDNAAIEALTLTASQSQNALLPGTLGQVIPEQASGQTLGISANSSAGIITVTGPGQPSGAIGYFPYSGSSYIQISPGTNVNLVLDTMFFNEGTCNLEFNRLRLKFRTLSIEDGGSNNNFGTVNASAYVIPTGGGAPATLPLSAQNSTTNIPGTTYELKEYGDAASILTPHKVVFTITYTGGNRTLLVDDIQISFETIPGLDFPSPSAESAIVANALNPTQPNMVNFNLFLGAGNEDIASRSFFTWDFGDGNTFSGTGITGGTPVHTFNSVDTFNICVTIMTRVTLSSDCDSVSTYLCTPLGVIIAALPVTLTSFTGRSLGDGQVQLQWATASEVNNAYFSVEHSPTGQSFSPIGQADGAGTTNQPQTYSFLHTGVGAGIQYYRLRQVDFDGTTAYSPVISVNVKGDAPQTLRVYPNPAHDQVWIEQPIAAPVRFTLFNAQGQLIRQGAWNQDLNTLDIQDLQAGLYVLRITDPQGQPIHTATVQKQ